VAGLRASAGARACAQRRLTFVGHTDPYPKDLALLLYGPSVSPGYEMWMWANDAHEDGAS
jgi:hypothetical protein